ncbi:MAG: 30S ribosomal protein S13 [bacterium]
MARISGIELPKDKQVSIALTYIKGIGVKTSEDILSALKIDFSTKVRDLEEDQIVKIRQEVSKILVEGDLLRKVRQDIKRLKDIGCYKGQRHKRNLPCRGQRTHTNARTKRGKKIAVAGKKKVTK